MIWIKIKNFQRNMKKFERNQKKKKKIGTINGDEKIEYGKDF